MASLADGGAHWANDDKTTVGSQIILEVQNGRVQTRGESSLDEAEQIFVVVDPRNAEAHIPLLDVMKKHQKKTTLFLLLPSMTSSPTCLTGIEVGIMSMGCFTGEYESYPSLPTEQICYVRLDDYKKYGDQILIALANAEGKTVYPREEAATMAG